MKKLLLFLFLFSTISGFSQLGCENNEPTPTEMYPKGELTSSRAKERIGRYRDTKNKAAGRSKYLDSIIYHPCGFLDLLKKLTDKTKNYSGLRIYFGSNSADNNKLMLLFVFTTREQPNGYRIHQDDLSSCYTIVGNSANKITAEQASGYVKSYLNIQHADFKFTGQAHYDTVFHTQPAPRFDETISLWFDISLFWPGKDLEDDRTGLVTYLQYLINKHEIDNLVVDLGAFEHTGRVNWYYQLTLVFDFNKAGVRKNLFSGNSTKDPTKAINQFFTENKKLNKKEYFNVLESFARYNFGYANTGVPCPPPPTGTSTCGNAGGQLPLP